jgi:hypothetical protein
VLAGCFKLQNKNERRYYDTLVVRHSLLPIMWDIPLVRIINPGFLKIFLHRVVRHKLVLKVLSNKQRK